LFEGVLLGRGSWVVGRWFSSRIRRAFLCQTRYQYVPIGSPSASCRRGFVKEKLALFSSKALGFCFVFWVFLGFSCMSLEGLFGGLLGLFGWLVAGFSQESGEFFFAKHATSISL